MLRAKYIDIFYTKKQSVTSHTFDLREEDGSFQQCVFSSLVCHPFSIFTDSLPKLKIQYISFYIFLYYHVTLYRHTNIYKGTYTSSLTPHQRIISFFFIQRTSLSISGRSLQVNWYLANFCKGVEYSTVQYALSNHSPY